MTDNIAIPPLRDLPPGHLAARKQHLLSEITRAPKRPRLSLPTIPLFQRPRSWRPVVVVAVAVTALAGTGVAIADGLGAFNGIGAAQHPQTGADVIDPATRAYMEGGSNMPIIGGLLFDTARVVGQIPSGQNIYVITTKSNSLCFVVGPPHPEWNCEDPLSRSHSSAIFAYTQDGKPYTVVGIALDGVTAVSFDENGQGVSLPVENNIWTYQSDSSDALASPMFALTVHFADGTTVVQNEP